MLLYASENIMFCEDKPPCEQFEMAMLELCYFMLEKYLHIYFFSQFLYVLVFPLFVVVANIYFCLCGDFTRFQKY